MDALKITSCTKSNEDQYCLLCSSDIQSTAEFLQQQEDTRDSFASENHVSSSFHKHLSLHYEAFQEAELVHHKFAVCLADLDIHCYPSIISRKTLRGHCQDIILISYSLDSQISFSLEFLNVKIFL